MVAKSYQTLEQIGEPFAANHKYYVKVKTATGTIKTVRWYSEREYYKMYGEKPVESENHRPLKEVLGFSKGYITIFKGDTYPHKDWFKMSSARYARYWGWYFVSEEELPSNIPEGIEPVKLYWEKVSKDDETILPEDQIRKIVDEIIFDPSPSQYFGTLGTRYQLDLTVKKVVQVESAYGISNIHTMEDVDKNVFVWATTSRTLTPNVTYHMTAGIKDHKEYQNTHRTPCDSSPSRHVDFLLLLQCPYHITSFL